MGGSLVYDWNQSREVSDWFLEGDALARVTDAGAIRLETIDLGHGVSAGTLWLKRTLPESYHVGFDFTWREGVGASIFFASAVGVHEDIFSWSRSGSWFSYVCTRRMRLYTLSFCKAGDEAVSGLRKVWSPPPPASGQELCPRVVEAPDPCTERERIYHIDVRKYGNVISLAVDGQTLCAYEDDGERYGPVLGEGRVAIRSFSKPKTIEVSNFVIEGAADAHAG